MKTKEVVDELTVKRAITRITYEIIERNKDLNKIILAGIKTRGVFIAHRIKERLEQLENITVPVVELDTKPFRDDVKSGEDGAAKRQTSSSTPPIQRRANKTRSIIFRLLCGLFFVPDIRVPQNFHYIIFSLL